jgi:protein-tyrosine phosphatase
MAERSADALRAIGIEPDGHRARDVSDVLALADVSLVLTLERTHRAAVLDLAPVLLHRTFTLVEFARIAEAAPTVALHREGAGRPEVPERAGRGLAELVRAVRTARLPAAAPSSDDVLDPVLGDDADHEHFRDRVAGPIDTVAALVVAATRTA